jgi:hypothetical protein
VLLLDQYLASGMVYSDDGRRTLANFLRLDGDSREGLREIEIERWR